MCVVFFSTVTARKLTPLCLLVEMLREYAPSRMNPQIDQKKRFSKTSQPWKSEQKLLADFWQTWRFKKPRGVLLRLPPDDQGFGHGGIQSQHQSTERSLEKPSVQGTFLGEGGMTPQMAGGLGWRYCDFIFFLGG